LKEGQSEVSLKILYIIGVSIILALLIFGFVYHISNAKTTKLPAEIKKEELLVEYNLLKPFPNSVCNKLSSSNKERQALVSASYLSDKPYNEIRQFYIDEAAKNGWTFFKEETVHGGYGFIDEGGKNLKFRKGQYTLDIQYAGEKADYGWNFGVSMSWGLH
jgi:signal peptidase I